VDTVEENDQRRVAGGMGPSPKVPGTFILFVSRSKGPLLPVWLFAHIEFIIRKRCSTYLGGGIDL